MSDDPLISQKMALVKASDGLTPYCELLHVEGFRWTVSQPTPDFYKHMLKLERKLHELTGRPVDLRVETLEDRNKREKRSGRE